MYMQITESRETLGRCMLNALKSIAAKEKTIRFIPKPMIISGQA